jgi:LuxR family maltose regulon positive regulatory protein
VAWLSLGQRDNDPVVFWTGPFSALQASAHGVGAGALALLQSSQASMDEVLAILVNDLNAVDDHLVMLLDDYHVVTRRARCRPCRDLHFDDGLGA